MRKPVKHLLLFTTMFSIINNMAHPVTPKFVLDNNFDPKIFGYMLAAMGFGSMVSARFWGKVWDKYQSKWVIIIPYSLFYSLGQFIFSQATQEYTVLLARVFSGVFAAGLLYSTMPAIIAAHSAKENKTKNQVFLFGVLAFSANIGYGIGGFTGDFMGARNTIALQALLIFLMLLPGILWVKSVPKKDTSHTWAKDHPSVVDCVCDDFKKYKLYHFLIPLIPFFIIRISAGKFFDLLLLSNGYKTSELGLIVMGMGMLSTMFMFTIGQKLVTKFNNIKLITILMIFIMTPLLIASWVRNINVLILTFTISGLFVPLANSLTSAILVKRFSHKQGEVLGVRKAVHDFGIIVGPILFGIVFARSNWLTFTFAGAILIPTIVIFIMLNKWFDKNLGRVH